MTTLTTTRHPVKPTAPRRPKAAFGLGVEKDARLLRSWTEGSLVCELVYDAAWNERGPGALPYRLYLAGPGYLGSETFATQHGVDLYVRDVTERLDFEAFMAEEDARKAAERPRRRSYTFEPAPSDREWWREHDTEASLGRLAPLSGGAPVGEPEAECGLSGHWHLPGEDDEIVADLYPAERECLDLPTGGGFGHEA